jgi:VIT1/CCC1 family predicted Fe2+/Mn2+ transporter
MESLEQFFKGKDLGYARGPRRMAYAKLQKNTQGMDREQLEAFIKANLMIPHSQYKMALGNLIQFLNKQDKMSQLNEVRQFQKLAGLLKENQADQIADKVEDSVEARLDRLTPEQIQQLQADLAKIGITADTSVEDAAQKIEGSLDEAEGDDKKKLADTLQSIGTGLIGSLLVPIIPVAIGAGTGLGTATGLGITFAAGGLLVGLAKALKHKGDGKVSELHPDREWDEEDDQEETGEDYPSDEELFGLSEDDYSEDPSSDMDDESQSGDTDAMNINEDEETKKRQEYARYVNGFISQNEEDLNNVYETQGYLAALKVVRDKVAAILHNAGKYEYPTAGGGIGDNFPLVDAITRLFKHMGYKKK